MVDSDSALESLAAGNESWYKLNKVDAMFGQIKGGSGNGLCDAARGYLGRETIVKKDNIDFINVIAVIIPEPGSLATKASQYSGSITTSGQVKVGNETFKMHPEKPEWGSYKEAAQAEPVLYASTAPYFISEGLIAIYGGETMKGMQAQGFGFGDVIASSTGTQEGNWAFTVRETVAAWSKVTSPYLFMMMRANADVSLASGPAVTNVTPRIGILVGSVTTVARA